MNIVKFHQTCAYLCGEIGTRLYHHTTLLDYINVNMRRVFTSLLSSSIIYKRANRNPNRNRNLWHATSAHSMRIYPSIGASVLPSILLSTMQFSEESLDFICVARSLQDHMTQAMQVSIYLNFLSSGCIHN